MTLAALLLDSYSYISRSSITVFFLYVLVPRGGGVGDSK